jgi:hypothetical protein
MRRSTLTVGRYLDFLGASEKLVEWPPDVFGVAVSLLQKSGAYTRAISDWPPIDRSSAVPVKTQARQWTERMKALGAEWRNGAMTEPRNTPTDVVNWWHTVLNADTSNIADIRMNTDLCNALLQLCAVADEACAGVGLPPFNDEFETEAWLILDDRGTLCLHVDPTILRVLPKCHTPKVGMTIRSLSHHLSLIPAGDVEPHWYIVEPQKKRGDAPAARTLNLLLVPQPRLVLPGNFRSTDGPLQNMESTEFGFFTCDLQGRVDLDHVVALFDRARSIVECVDAVILPELSLSEGEYEQLRRLIVQNRKTMLVAGVGDAARAREFGQNYVRFDIPVDIPATDEEDRAAVEPQRKHHRWLLDGSQINQYGLGTRLDPGRKWWECIDIAQRELAFVSMEPWLTLSVLICEDLARQDPVAELIRSVGPNLVVALLADGPQLAARWPARYATVLADDPGSSVLTLTSAGMVDLCRGPRRMLDSRPVALWKDALTGGPYELNLPADADALLLCLGVDYKEEWTADGRSDAVERADGTKGGTTSYLTMLCVHPIAVPPPAPGSAVLPRPRPRAAGSSRRRSSPSDPEASPPAGRKIALTAEQSEGSES